MFLLGATMSTPAKRHCCGPVSSLNSSFQKRLKKISIEGNIGELGSWEGSERDARMGGWGSGTGAPFKWHGSRWGRCGSCLRSLFHQFYKQTVGERGRFR